MNDKFTSYTRRDFIKGSGAVLGGTLIGASLPFSARGYASGGEVLKIALVGCGARGAGAAVNALRADKNLRLVALADAFRDKLDETYNNLTKIEDIKGSIDVPEEHKFVGFDGYKEAIALADVVLLVTPPAFRPLHFDASIQAGKHVFMEKPLASDAPGIRQVLATGELAKKKNLKVQVGLQNRYDPAFIEMVDRIHSGVIGDIVSSTDYYMVGPVKLIPRQEGQTEMEYQMRNWRHFNWLWAGSPAGLQIHNTDIVNWVKESYPVRAHALGGRSAFSGPEHGDIFDHFFVEYEYADGSKLNSQIRTVKGTFNKGGAYFQGTKGSGNVRDGLKDLSGSSIWRNRSKDGGNPYQLEHDQFFAAIRNDTPMNDTEWGAMSTMTTILGRMAAHSGQLVEWNDALNSELSILPQTFAWDANPPVMPDENGNYPVPVPGESPIL
jgi:myo-inositol 2-dehydrogenase/D-chiro-inositol 1-dehydrogenase